MMKQLTKGMGFSVECGEIPERSTPSLPGPLNSFTILGKMDFMNGITLRILKWEGYRG